MKKYDLVFEVGKKYVNRSAQTDMEGNYVKDGYIMLLSDKFVEKTVNGKLLHFYQVEVNGKKCLADWRFEKSTYECYKEKGRVYDEEPREDNLMVLHCVTSTGKNWARNSVGLCAENF